LGMGRLETTDIFRGAFFLASGGNLAEVRVRQNGKRIASFLFTGQLRESLNRLRDVMFEKLRKSEETRYDRKGKDPVHQARR